MRRLFLVSAFLLACGGSSSDGGGGGGLSGTVGGRSFTPREVRAIPAGTGTTPCTVPVLGQVGVRALALDFASYADACGDYATSQCRLHAGAQNVTLLFAKLDPSGAEPTLAAGTYTVYGSATTAVPDGTGRLTVTFAESLATGAAPTCAGTPSPSVQGGTLRLDQITGSAVTGHVSLTFEDGSSLQGDFSAPVCPGQGPDICMLATAQALCTAPPICMP
ncbi:MULTISPECIES: hypothetical protein [Anaeromyxobacter]|uniref:hypothetical protein n=1 Tax=Anaeromyxobacter TaxID=161492 RepID=UPI001F599E7B|nr:MULTISPECIES: hypothetical protein [unclassified Anaeromyxobacter]